MTREENETAWPLVIRHRDKVVRFLEARRTATPRKFSRGAMLDDYERLRDISCLADKYGVSASTVYWIMLRAIRAARGFEAGTLALPRPRRTFTLTLTELPARLPADVDAWAQMRGMSRKEAAVELMKTGLRAVASNGRVGVS